MTWLTGFLRNQGQLLLKDNRHAMFYAGILAVLPYTTWLSVAVIALVVLRKNERDAVLALLVGMTAYFLSLQFSMTVAIALISTILTFVPCFLAAHVLRKTASWRAVAGLCFFQVLIAVMLLHKLMPDFIMAQFAYIQSVINSVQSDSELLGFFNDKSEQNQLLLANYLLGIQAVGIMFSAILSLMLARSVQSQLFYPGAYDQEMLTFRGDRTGLLMLVMMFYAANQGNILAMNILPLLVFYFLLAGLSLGFNVFARKKKLSFLLLLVIPLFILPFVVLPVYVIFGSLDSIFNFRLYLPANAGKRT